MLANVLAIPDIACGRFDFKGTTDMAGETQEWVEKSLLQGLIRATWLRVVIAGQRVPEASGAVWATVAHPTVQLELPQPADWYDYGRLHRPDLKLEQVETACNLARGKASLLAQLLGPGG